MRKADELFQDVFPASRLQFAITEDQPDVVNLQ